MYFFLAIFIGTYKKFVSELSFMKLEKCKKENTRNVLV